MRGILFDLDGVLIDSKEFHWQSWQLLQQDYPEFTTSYTEFLHAFGETNGDILRRKFPQKTPQQVRQMSERKEEIFRQQCKEKICLLPGMLELLTLVEKRNIPKIIASSTTVSNLQFFLQHTVLGQYFFSFVAGEQVAAGKPAPDVFIEAARRLQLPPQECVVFEDSTAGLRAARAAGCLVVAIGTTHRQEELMKVGYDLFFPSGREIELEKCQL